MLATVRENNDDDVTEPVKKKAPFRLRERLKDLCRSRADRHVDFQTCTIMQGLDKDWANVE